MSSKRKHSDTDIENVKDVKDKDTEKVKSTTVYLEHLDQALKDNISCKYVHSRNGAWEKCQALLLHEQPIEHLTLEECAWNDIYLNHWRESLTHLTCIEPAREGQTPTFYTEKDKIVYVPAMTHALPWAQHCAKLKCVSVILKDHMYAVDLQHVYGNNVTHFTMTHGILDILALFKHFPKLTHVKLTNVILYINRFHLDHSTTFSKRDIPIQFVAHNILYQDKTCWQKFVKLWGSSLCLTID